MLGINEIVILSAQLKKMAKDIKETSDHLEKLVLAYEYNKVSLSTAKFNEQGDTLLLPNDDGLDADIQNYGEKNGK